MAKNSNPFAGSLQRGRSTGAKPAGGTSKGPGTGGKGPGADIKGATSPHGKPLKPPNSGGYRLPPVA